MAERLGIAILDRSGCGQCPRSACVGFDEDDRPRDDDAEAWFDALDGFRTFALPSLHLDVTECLAPVPVPPLVPPSGQRIGGLDVHCALRIELEDELIVGWYGSALANLGWGFAGVPTRGR